MSATDSRAIYELPPLPFARNALAPIISEQTLAYHHDRHHRAYVAKVNELVAGTPLQGAALEDIVRQSKGALFNSAAQAWNHAFYWNCLSPERGLAPSAQLRGAIERDFGSLDDLVTKFRANAIAKFGSGWTWLVLRENGTLAVENTDDADTPLRAGRAPLLTCDVWEHAYYLDYQNERPRYVDGFLKLVDWNFVSQNFAVAPLKGTEYV